MGKEKQETNSVKKNQGGGIWIGQKLKRKIGTIPGVEMEKGFLGRKITCKRVWQSEEVV